MEFSKQEYWSGLPFPSLGDLPEPGIKLRFPALQADSLSSEPPGKPLEWNFIRRQFSPAAELGEGGRKPNGAGAPWEGGHLREAEPEVEGAIEPDNIPEPPDKVNSM